MLAFAAFSGAGASAAKVANFAAGRALRVGRSGAHAPLPLNLAATRPTAAAAPRPIWPFSVGRAASFW